MSRRTAIKNSIRSILDQQSVAWPSGRAGWSQKTLESLKQYVVDLDSTTVGELWRVQLTLEYDALQQAKRLVAAVEDRLGVIAKANERVRRLRTVPGVGPRLAEPIVAVIDGPHRFQTAKQLGAYASLIPKQYESGTMSRQERITCRGNSLLRAMLVEVGWMMRRYNSWFNEIFERVCRGARTRKKITVIAVDQRMLGAPT